MTFSPKFRENARGLMLSMLVVVLAMAVYFMSGLSGLEDRLGVDFRLRLRGARPPHPDIVIIAVDEPSIAALGRWPWDRAVHANLIKRLTRAGAKAIAFDILFTETDQCGRSWSDEALGKAANESGRVVFGGLFHYDKTGRPMDPLLPIKPLDKDRVAMGVVNIFPEMDGVTRKIPVVVEADEQMVPSLSFAAYALYKDMTPEAAFNELQPPVDATPWHEMNVDFVGGNGFQQFPYYSFADVLRGKIPAEAFRDKIVLVGGTAVGLFDFKSVPNISNFPGIEIHANALDNMIRRRFLVRDESLWRPLVLMAVFGLLCGFLALKVPMWAGALSAAVLFGYFVLCQTLFTRQGIILNYVGPAFGVLFSYLVLFFVRFRRENKEKKRIRGTFAQYLSPEVVEILTKNPDLVRLGGEDREMTVFFSDLAGFTTISESMTPRELVSVLNEYLTTMSEIIFRHGGVVDKYIGDAIMAFWNAPLEQPDHASLACLTALDQQDALRELQSRFAERKLPHIDFRVGINTGHMVVGNMGSAARMDYTVMGDAVNLASRLEGANKSFRSRIMISEFTYQKARDAIEVRPLDLIRVKGKTVPIQVYELVDRKGALTPDQKNAFGHYAEGLKLYHDRQFARAMDAFKKTLGLLPHDGPSRTYIERCETFIAFPPPPAWDGVFVMTTK